uniref:Uncharacterized protein n=1 Tax=Anguilla anguilla TaxID=7936 RepID=A0A0E9SFN2_ANGAN
MRLMIRGRMSAVDLKNGKGQIAMHPQSGGCLSDGHPALERCVLVHLQIQTA